MAPPSPHRLDGWKAIADYLGRDVRTLQRWRDERGMPVHRVPGTKGGTVFAYSTELDAWLRETPSVRNGDHAAAVAEHGKDRSAPSGPKGPGAWRWRRVTWWLAGAAALAMGSIAVGTLEFPWSPRTFERAELRAGSLVALDGEGRTAWSFKLPERSAGPSAAPLFPSLREAAPVDLDGDGERELIAFLAFLERPGQQWSGSGEVYCLSSSGALLWTFRPELTLTFGGRTFTGPWWIRDWLVAGPRAPVWVSFIHQTWWPSFVVMLDATGRSTLKFVNAGHIESLGRVATASGTYVLAGGTNNEHGAASLAILDEQGPSATSPPSGASLLTCDRCPSGRPARYFLFPRSELNMALGNARNFVHGFTPNEAGGVDVTVREHDDPPLRGVYRLSADLTPEWLAMSDAYWEMHRRLTAEGKLNHSPEECPERTRGMSVRSWDPQSEWKELLMPQAFAPDAAGRTSTQPRERGNGPGTR